MEYDNRSIHDEWDRYKKIRLIELANKLDTIYENIVILENAGFKDDQIEALYKVFKYVK